MRMTFGRFIGDDGRPDYAMLLQPEQNVLSNPLELLGRLGYTLLTVERLAVLHCSLLAGLLGSIRHGSQYGRMEAAIRRIT